MICLSTQVTLLHPQPRLPTPQLRTTHSGNKNLCAGGSHGAAGHFNVEATFGVLLTPEGRVVEGLVPCLPVAYRLPDGLQDTKWETRGAEPIGLLQSQHLPASHTALRTPHSGARGGRGNGPGQREILKVGFSLGDLTSPGRSDVVVICVN